MASRMDFSTFHNVIDGKLTSTPKTRHSIDPATEEPNPEVPLSTQEDLDKAVLAAKKAQKSWQHTTIAERHKLFTQYADALESYRKEFIDLLISEQGKAQFLADDEVSRAVAMIRDTSTLELNEETVHETDAMVATVRYVPIGVCAALVPWNYPILLAMAKISAGLWTGNAVIVKPSPDTPYCGLKLVELGMQFFPPGVLQAVSGGHELGPMCTAHPGIDKISFTGSIATGKKVMESCSKTLKRVTLELGGNDAVIICEDVDVDTVAPQISTLSFINSGQICMAIKRIYVHEAIYDRFLSAMVSHAKNLGVGSGKDPKTFVGPLQNATQFEKVKSYQEDIEKNGLHAVLGGSSNALLKESLPKGYFITPTIIDNPADTERIVREEPFGPIVPLMKWSGSDDAIVERANDTLTGLGASVWSADVVRAEKMARQLQAGSVWVNAHFYLSAKVPFGGHKNSGIGMEFGLVGLKHWCNPQSLWTPKAKI
ncbi:aldehyde dehydrogenase protein [Rutstroemia sp. NJR-2017a BBW]|nr:aldehyde dehydrogenase protein [Rutstroemia sp. NJR-2017a BBW]